MQKVAPNFFAKLIFFSLISITMIFGEDKMFTYTQKMDGDQETITGTWSATGNKLTLIIDGEAELIDYSISGNILSFETEDFEEGVTTEFTCEKQ